MKNFFEKKVNKLIVGGVLGTAILGFGGFSMSPKGKSFWKKVKNKFKGAGNFVYRGFSELKKKLKKSK